MPRITKDMPSFQGVAAGQTAICNCPVGLTYNVLAIEHLRSGVAATEAQMKAELGDVRVLINGEVKIEASATELIDLAKYNGVTIEPGVLPIIFARPWSRTANGEDALSYGTADVQTMTVEVDIDAAATSPALSMTAQQSAPTQLGKHITLKRFGRTAGGAGTLEVSDLPRGNYGLLALHLNSSAVTEVEIEADGKLVYDADSKRAKFFDSLTGKDWTVSNSFHVNFANTDRVGDTLPLNLQDFRVRATMSGASTFQILQERIDTHVA